MKGLPERGLDPAELAASKPHGSRVRYIGGCRCDPCRGANTAYEKLRQIARQNGEWIGLVDSAKSRQHLDALSQAGVGRRAVAAASDVPNSILTEIKSGKRPKIRAATERRILAVTPDMMSDRALIDAAPSWALINALCAAGFTRGNLAQRLGAKGKALQVGKDKITARKAQQIAKLHRDLLPPEEVEVVDSRQAKRLLKELLAEGYRLRQIAQRAGIEEDQLVALDKRIPKSLEKKVSDAYVIMTT